MRRSVSTVEISTPHHRPRERSAASSVEYRPFKKGNAAERKRALSLLPYGVRINLYVALRNQAKEAATPNARCATPRSR